MENQNEIQNGASGIFPTDNINQENHAIHADSAPTQSNGQPYGNHEHYAAEAQPGVNYAPQIQAYPPNSNQTYPSYPPYPQSTQYPPYQNFQPQYNQVPPPAPTQYAPIQQNYYPNYYQPYGYPVYYPPLMNPPKPASGLALASFILSLVSLFFIWIPFLNIALGLTSLILGIVAKAKGNNGLAIAGIIIGSIALLISVVFVFVFFIFYAASVTESSDYSDWETMTLFFANKVSGFKWIK